MQWQEGLYLNYWHFSVVIYIKAWAGVTLPSSTATEIRFYLHVQMIWWSHTQPGGRTKYQPATRGQPAVLVWFSFKYKMCIANHPDDLGLAEPTSCLLCFSSTDLRGAWMKWQGWKVWPEVEQQVQVHSELTCWLAYCTRMSNAGCSLLTGWALPEPCLGQR